MDSKNVDTPRTAREIARRVIVLHCVIAAAHGVSKSDIAQWLQEEQLWDELTPRELKFLAQKKNSIKETNFMTWMAEAQAMLLWAIQKLEKLPLPTEKCDTRPIVDAMPGLFETTIPFIESATLHSAKKIEQTEESIYELHCQVCKVGQTGQPANLKDILFFRHYGMSWVIGYDGQSWDEVTPDI